MNTGNTQVNFDDEDLEDITAPLTEAKHLELLNNNIEILRRKKKELNGMYSRELEMHTLGTLFAICKILHARKSNTYRDSWKKRGWVLSIFSNVARKFDRLEKIFMNTELIVRFIDHPDPNDDEEQAVDTFVDGGVYHFLAVTEFILTKPEIFDAWMKRNKLKP